jgi:hypothetical protein
MGDTMRITRNMIAALIAIPAVGVGVGLQACSSGSSSSAAPPASISSLSYTCSVADNASNTDVTGMTVLDFTVKVDNPAGQATSNLPAVQIYVQDYAGAPEQGPYPFPVGHSMPPGVSTLKFTMNAYANVDLCSVAS